LIPIAKNHQKKSVMDTNDLNKLAHDGDNLHSEHVSETTLEAQSVTAEAEMDHLQPIVEPDAGIHPEDEFEAHKPHIDDLEKVDHESLTKQKLVARLKHVLHTFPIDQVKDEVETVKAAFYKLLKAETEVLKAKFVESGELEENFKAPIDHDEHELKELIKQYRDKRAELNETLEEEKDRNFTAKSDVVEAIKSLVNRQESLNDTFQEFRDLQQKWRDIGPVPQAKVRDLWNSYNYAIESFYNYIHINKELRDLDLKKNLEVKLGLCESAEKLLLEPNIVTSFNALQKLHDQWREAGPVPKEKKDEVWDRFKEATSIINKKHQEHFEGVKDQLRQNLEAKAQLCEKAEEIVAVADKIDSPREWEEKSKALVDIQQLWKTIGFAPKKDNNKIYERFRTACDKFFEHKRDYFKDYKSEQHNNLQLKTELCLQAEALKGSTEWKKTTDEFIKIQKRWKEIGPVPRKQSDLVWKRFRAACDEFFDNKSKHFHHIDDEQDQNLKLKQQIIEEVKALVPAEQEGEQTFILLQELPAPMGRNWPCAI
jgi:predicted XRE-type DNA-binding protein